MRKQCVFLVWMAVATGCTTAGTESDAQIDSSMSSDARADVLTDDAGRDARSQVDAPFVQSDARVDASTVDAAPDASVCVAPQRFCGGVCAACPSDANATVSDCNGSACVIAACQSGFAPNRSGSACSPVNSNAIFSGVPVSIMRPSDAIAVSFGVSVALSSDGSTLVVGDYDGTRDFHGVVTVYTRTGNTWSNGTSLQRPSGAVNFGISVSLSADGDTLVVGDAGRDVDINGAATVYTRSGGTWSIGTSLQRPTGATYFGAHVSLSADGSTVVVGDYDGGGDLNGAATVFTRSGDTWGTGASLVRPTGAMSFGCSVSLSSDGSTLVVGDLRGGGDFRGAATVYTRDGNTWSSGSLERPTSASDFGSSVSLSSDGNTLVVGDVSGGGDRNGAATVYTRNGSMWGNGIILPRPGGAVDFGSSVSLSTNGNTVVVGDPNAGRDYHGAATVYTRNGTWSGGTNVQTLISGTLEFGHCVALASDGSALVVGDYQARSVSFYTR